MPRLLFIKYVVGVSIILIVSSNAVSGGGADVPPRSAGGQTLEVPESQLDLGEVYHVQPGEDAQVTFSTEGPLGRQAGLCQRVVGYVIAPFEPDAARAPVLAGAFRMPVASLETGDKQRSQLLRSQRWLDGQAFPEITFVISQARDAKIVQQTGDAITYTLTLVGPMTIKRVTKELEIPARVSLIPTSGQTLRLRTLGDLLTIRCSTAIKLSDFGLATEQNRSVGVRIGDEIKVDIFLLLSNVSPESRNLQAPDANYSQHLKAQKFLTLLRDLDLPDEACAHGEEFLREIWTDAQPLNSFASSIAEYSDAPKRALRLALRAARRANELTHDEDPAIMDTVARAYYELGDLAAALEWQRKAASHLGSAPAQVADAIKRSLQQYEQEVQSEAPQTQTDAGPKH